MPSHANELLDPMNISKIVSEMYDQPLFFGAKALSTPAAPNPFLTA